MALSPSTIVMAVLTCVPFGLAIRDQVTGEGRFDPAADEYDDDALERYGEYQVAIAEAKAAGRAAERERFTAVLAKLVTADAPAVLASRTIRLGMPQDESYAEERRELDRELGPGAEVALEFKREALDEIRVTLRRDEGSDELDRCELLSDHLDAVWRDGQSMYADDREIKLWLNPAAKVSATFVEGDARCVLELGTYAPIADWLGKTPDSVVPVAFLGQPAAKLIARLQGNAYSDATEVRWTGPGLGFGDTELYARIERGRIVTIDTKVTGGHDLAGLITARVIELYGTPRSEELPTRWAKPPITLHDNDVGDPNVYRLTIGKPLPAAAETAEE